MASGRRKTAGRDLTGVYFARIATGITQPELARRAGTSKQQIARLEQGKVVLTRAWAERLAPHLGRSSEQLLFWDLYLDDEGKPLSRPSGMRAKILRLIRNAGPKLAVQLKTNAAVKAFLAGGDDVEPSEAISAISDIAGEAAATEVSEWRPPGDMTRSVDSIPVIAFAEAGAFRTSAGFAGDGSEYQPISAPKSARFPGAKHFAAQVRGDSMNASKPPITDGTFVLCVDMVDAELAVETGQIYLIRRTMDGGQTYEWTVKRAKVFRDRVELHPESTNASHKAITIPRKNDVDMTDEVIAIGLVYGVFNSFESLRR